MYCRYGTNVYVIFFKENLQFMNLKLIVPNETLSISKIVVILDLEIIVIIIIRRIMLIYSLISNV